MNKKSVFLFAAGTLLLAGLVFVVTSIRNNATLTTKVSTSVTESETGAGTVIEPSTGTESVEESIATPQAANKKPQHAKPSVKYEERPKIPTLTGEEKEKFIAYMLGRADYESVRQRAPGANTATSSYVNGRLTGTWETKITRSGWFGYRVDNSAYDSIRDIFYVVSYAGHLYKLEYKDEVKWTLLNHKIQLNPPDNSQANPIFEGIHLSDGTFRLIRSNDDLQRMEYSDNEGKTWKSATGASISQSWSNQACIINTNGQKRVFLHTYYNNYHYLYYSDDNGQTYTRSKLSYPISTHDIRFVNPYNTNEVGLVVWNKSTKAVDMYAYDHGTKDFAFKHTSSTTLLGSNLSTIQATYLNGTYHYYVSTINTTYTVYYSSDEGKTWSLKVSDRDKPFDLLVYNKPGTLMSGFEDMKISTNYGANWSGFGNNLGWDLQHIKSFRKKDGKYTTLAGLDFGCYVSETPDIKTSYKWCNDRAHYAMHYDAASSVNYNTVYMGNQDRGTTAYEDTGAEVDTRDVDGTDVLRVAMSKHETGVWTWFYYGRIKHSYNFPMGKTESAVYDGLGNWWAAPIIPSPNPNEDAIYAAYGNQLQIFSYNEKTNSISKTAHPFDFAVKFGDNLGGFGYSELNRKIWYAALNNGTFLYSKDAGQTWTKSLYNSTKPRANDQYYNYAKNQITIRASENDTNRVYYAGVGNSLLISADAGRTFTLKNTGLTASRIRDFVVTPDDKFVFAACGYGGAWAFSTDDNRWYQLADDNIPSVDFTDVEYIGPKNIVRFATYGSGVIDFKLNEVVSVASVPLALSSEIEANNCVRLKWTDQAADEDGYYIERATDGAFERIGMVPANSTSYLDTNAVYNNLSYYVVRAFKGNKQSGKSNTTAINVPPRGIIFYKTVKMIAVSSEETLTLKYPATNAIDNNPATFWQTSIRSGQVRHPHYIVFDLGQETPIAGFRYLPRQDGSSRGNIANYELYVTNDTTNWGNAVAIGRFSTGSTLKEALSTEKKSGRFVKLVARSAILADAYTSAAEISLLYEALAPEKPTNLALSVSGETTLYMTWTDNSVNETGFLVEQLVGDEFVRVDTTKAGVTYYYHKNLTPDTKYTYRVRSYNTIGLSESSNLLEASTKVSTGIEELKMALQTYPNPVGASLTVEIEPQTETLELRILTLNGKVQLSEKLPAGNTKYTLNMSDLPKGIYLLEMRGSKGKMVRKIQKQ